MDTVFVALKGIPIFIAGHRIEGSNVAEGSDRLQLPGGYMITAGLPAQAWAAWSAENSQSALLQNDMIHADASLGALKAWCREHAATRSGFAPAGQGTFNPL